MNVAAGSVTPSASVISLGLWNDLKTMRWMIVPGVLIYSLMRMKDEDLSPYIASSLKLPMIPLVLWANWQFLSVFVTMDVSDIFLAVSRKDHRLPSADN
jgi:acyl-CoA-dependent ceramide synthase